MPSVWESDTQLKAHTKVPDGPFYTFIIHYAAFSQPHSNRIPARVLPKKAKQSAATTTTTTVLTEIIRGMTLREVQASLEPYK